MDKWIHRVITCLFFPASLVNMIVRLKDKKSPYGKVIQTARGAFHVIENGSGPVTVVFDAGLSGHAMQWHRVQEELSRFTHTISFDRGGYGWSEPRHGAHDAKGAGEDLDAILDALHCHSTLLLVAHSYGGLNARLYSSLHRERVKGLVLVDTVHEDRYMLKAMTDRRRKEWRNMLRGMRFAHYFSRTGFPRLFTEKVGGDFLFPELQEWHPAIGYRPEAYEAVYNELKDSALSAEQIRHCPPLDPSLPLTLIQARHTDPEWQGYVKKLKLLTKDPTIIETPHGHSIQMENPALVTGAILDTLRGIEHEETGQA
ncbi:alpha/beta hydrolase [Bacillus sp. JRC01]|nr:alpha/beta hydrolase [Bacillus sp. JRC01]